jgi:hypothetical protein
MITEIDHIIIAVDREEQPKLSDRLKRAGLVHGDAGRHPTGTANENLAFSSGGFLELLYEVQPGAANPVWFAETPRVQGIGFSTTDYAADIDGFTQAAGSWDRIFTKEHADGSHTEIRAAGPLPMDEFYPFVMDRPAPTFGDRGATARLTTLTFAGARSGHWRKRFLEWFRLPERDGALLAGDVVLRFVDGPHPDMRMSLELVAPGSRGTIPISGGAIELVAG